MYYDDPERTRADEARATARDKEEAAALALEATPRNRLERRVLAARRVGFDVYDCAVALRAHRESQAHRLPR